MVIRARIKLFRRLIWIGRRIHTDFVFRFFLILKKYRKQIGALLSLFTIALLQSTLLNYFRVFNIKPDIILATLILFSLFFSLGWLISFAFLIGIFRDLMSALPFGSYAVVCIIWVILAKRISLRLNVENIFIRSAMLCLIILLNNLTIHFIFLILDRAIAISVFLRLAIIESVFTLILASPMYRLFAHLFIGKSAQVASEVEEVT